jgi:ArsR family transcriptional regulator
MAYSKSQEFDTDLAQLADFADALSHPARLQILKFLATENRCVCGDIVQVVPLAQSTVSQHLKALKEVGLVRGEIEGPCSCYCINPESFDKMVELMTNFIASIKGSQKDNDCCK